MYNKKIDRLSMDKTLGYLYFIDKTHPLATGNSGRVYYHRHVMSEYLQRWILSSEVIHHINHNKLDNRVENLELLSSSEHASIHKPKLLKQRCYQCDSEYQPNKSNRKFCSYKCSNLASRKLDRSLLTKEELEVLIWTIGFSKAGKELGLSDNGVKKIAKNIGCLLPPPYFTNKVKAEDRLKEYKKAKLASTIIG